MLPQQFIDIIRKPASINANQLAELEVLVKEYPFFETAHLLFTKALHQNNSINYSKQLRKTAIVANSRVVLYELIHQKDTVASVKEPVQEKQPIKETAKPEIETPIAEEQKPIVNPISVTNSDIKVIYVNTVPSSKVEERVEEASTSSAFNDEKKPAVSITEQIESKVDELVNNELDIIKTIENETEGPEAETKEDSFKKELELEISKGLVQSYIETDVIKTPELGKEEVKEPVSFTDWLNKVKKEAGTIQTETGITLGKKEEETPKIEEKPVQTEKKPQEIEQKRQLIDKIIEADPGRIKLGNTKFFTPSTDAKQSLLENEHLVTETLAKIYALQGNISKAIRAYEILSLKFPQKSVYFASLIEKLKTNK